MTRYDRQSGFSAVELLVTLFVAAAFLISGYQLYIFAVKDGGSSRTQAAASRKADNYIMKYKTSAKDPCVSSTPLSNSPVNIAGVGTAMVTVGITCPFLTTDTATSLIKVTLTYGSPTKTIVSSTFYKPICPTNFIQVPGNKTYGTKDFCVMKFEAKNGGSNTPVSQASGAPWTSISQTNAMDYARNACTGCHLITETEWLTIAADITKVTANWSVSNIGYYWIHSGLFCNGTTPAFSTPRQVTNESSAISDVPSNPVDCGNPNTAWASDRSYRLFQLTNGESLWDFSGNAAEWTSGQTIGGQPGNGSSLAWRAWTTSSITTHGTLSPDPWPVSITGMDLSSEDGSFGFYGGLGRIQSDADDDTLKGFIRGGSVGHGLYNSGIYALDMSRAPSWTGDSNTGFRVAR